MGKKLTPTLTLMNWTNKRAGSAAKASPKYRNSQLRDASQLLHDRVIYLLNTTTYSNLPQYDLPDTRFKAPTNLLNQPLRLIRLRLVNQLGWLMSLNLTNQALKSHQPT
jgi:hypothetical protein